MGYTVNKKPHLKLYGEHTISAISSRCGLIIATLLKAKEIKKSMPDALILISPVVDYTKNGEYLKTRG